MTGAYDRAILLIRHGEATKNLEDRYGGAGTGLTKQGINQCFETGNYIRATYSCPRPWTIIGHEVSQVRETAMVIGTLLGVEPRLDPRLRGIHLGVLSGLSSAEAVHRWPAAARNLDEWRSGHLSIGQVSVPGAEPLCQFKARLQSLFLELLNDRVHPLTIAVSNRSALTMIFNIVRMWGQFSYDDYRFQDFSPASITEIQRRGGFPGIIKLNEIAHLSRRVA
jgi:broad specificity phosphatase PhoE